MISSSLHKGISSVQRFVLKGRLINNPIIYCCAPPCTPLMIMQHFYYTMKSYRAFIGKAAFEEQKSAIQQNPGLLLHVTVAWCLMTPWLLGPHHKLVWTYALVSVKAQSCHSASSAQKDKVIHKSSKFINQIL